MLNYNFNAIYMFSKTSKIVFILFIFSNVLLYSQIRADQKLDPVFKSLIIPGWGQKTLGKPKRARFYNYIESGILLTLISSSTFSNIEKKNYKAFASRHAGISSSGKDHKYWVDIGNYNSINAYNDEHLRNREIDDLYSDDNKWSWGWDLELNRKIFENKRIRSDQLELFATFSVGALILNHLISSIDALYLKRISSNNSLSINPYKNLILGSIGYSLTLSF
mgnify:CR=1 FL=1|jgi:hypothetical protein|tara:strand:- start:5777 stop:6442 length:666 start_codon:yes stop_codon:yes gene_type:complete